MITSPEPCYTSTAASASCNPLRAQLGYRSASLITARIKQIRACRGELMMAADTAMYGPPKPLDGAAAVAYGGAAVQPMEDAMAAPGPGPGSPATVDAVASGRLL